MPKTPRLREWREHSTLSQSELATRSGISRATIADLEAGNRRGQPRTIRRLAEALSIEPENLYGEIAYPKIRRPLSAERALSIADSDDFRRVAMYAPTAELQATVLELVALTRTTQTTENPSSPGETHRRVLAHERIGIIRGELERRGQTFLASSVATRRHEKHQDATASPDEAPRLEREGREAG